MSSDEVPEIEAIAAGIAKHLRDHPNAADSAEGVARWWLEGQFASAASQRVERALELLVARGVMQRLQLMNGRFLYSEAGPAE